MAKLKKNTNFILVITILSLALFLTNCATTGGTKPTTASKDYGQTTYAKLQLKGKDFLGGKVNTKALFGGVCTLPGSSGDWIVFPLLAPDASTMGNCVQASPVMGAITKEKSDLIEELKTNDVVELVGVVSDKPSPFRTGITIQIESINKVGANQPAKNPFTN